MSNRMSFFARPQILKLSIADGEEMISILDLRTAFSSNWRFSQEKSISYNIDSSYTQVSKFYAPALERTSSFNSCVPCWLRMIRFPPNWLLRKCCLWDISKIQAGIRSSWEHIVISWIRSFTVRVIESAPKSVHQFISLTEIEENILLKCGLKKFQRRLEKKLDHFAATNRSSTGSCHKRKDSFFGSCSGAVDCDWRRYFCSKGKGFSAS